MTASFRRSRRSAGRSSRCSTGSALGGGWEVALIGHARFALDDPKIRFGMPEVTLGLIPGATGITKTVRTLGLMAAQPYLLEGKLFGPREALELGWVDGLARSADELRAQALAWIDAHPDAVQPWDRKDYRMPGGTPASPKIAAALAVAPAMLAQKTRGLYPATQAILEAMVEGALVDYDTAAAHRGEKARQGHGRADRQEHDPGVLLRPAGDPVRQGAAEGLRVVAAGEGRRPRRRHDGRRHRPRQRVARHRLRAEGRLGREGRGGPRGDPQGDGGAGQARRARRARRGEAARARHADRRRRARSTAAT